MSKKLNQIKVYGTKDGKLYIKASNLFEQKDVQTLVEKITNSDLVKGFSNKTERS